MQQLSTFKLCLHLEGPPEMRRQQGKKLLVFAAEPFRPFRPGNAYPVSGTVA